MVLPEVVQGAPWVTNKHSSECKARFDAIFSRRGEFVGPIRKPIADGEEIDYEASIARDQFPSDEVPECPPGSDDEDELQQASKLQPPGHFHELRRPSRRSLTA